MENNISNAKKTLGRRKIQIKKIEKKTSRQVTFTKRRGGLFRKASELRVLCGAEIAMLVQSPAGKVFSFANPSIESVIHRYLHAGYVETNTPRESATVGSSTSRTKYNEIVRRLEGHQKKNNCTEKDSTTGSMVWWDDEVESMGLEELEGFLESLEGLRINVMDRVKDKEEELSKKVQQVQEGGAVEAADGDFNFGVPLCDDDLDLISLYLSSDTPAPSLTFGF